MFNAGEGFDQVRTHDFELAAVMRGEFLQQPGALGGDTQENTAGVRLVARAFEQAFFFGAIGELNHAVVAQAEALGGVGDGGDGACRGAGDLEQQLVLLGLKTGGMRGLLTELDKGAKAIAKFGQPFDQAGRGGMVLHRYIVSRHIVSSDATFGSGRGGMCKDVGMRRIVVMLIALLVSLPGIAQHAPANAAWNRPVAPFRIADNLYYVGTEGIASYLIVTPAGNILLDTGLRESAPLVEASIRKLGFRVEDVHILLLSHAHSDHAGGLAAMKAATHARLLVSPGDAPELERGGKDDFAFANRMQFPPVKPDGLLQDGVPVTLGGVSMTPHFTPGHTKGCTTWTMTVRDRGQLRHVVFAGSLSAPGYQVVNNPKYPGMLKDYHASIATMRALPCDIFLAAHAEQFGMAAKLAALKAHPDGPNPFVDPAGYLEYLDESEAELNKKAAVQSREKGVPTQAEPAR